MKETVILDLETYLQMRSDIDDLTNQVEFWKNKKKEEVEEEVIQKAERRIALHYNNKAEELSKELSSKQQKIKELEEELSDSEGYLHKELERKKTPPLQ